MLGKSFLQITPRRGTLVNNYARWSSPNLTTRCSLFWLIFQLLFVAGIVNGQSTCAEKLYLNDEPPKNAIHKFRINAGTGAVTEIGSPWYPSINNPHGLAVDLNGNVYVGSPSLVSNNIQGDLWKFRSYGEDLSQDYLLPPNDNRLGFNFGSRNGIMYMPNNANATVEAYDLCDGSLIGKMNIQAAYPNPAGNGQMRVWGFYVDDQYWYAAERYTGHIYRGSLDKSLYTDPATNAGSLWLDTGLPAPPSGPVVDDAPMGLTRDANGNTYIVFNRVTGAGVEVKIRKYDPNGALLLTVSDNVNSGANAGNGQSGFWGARAIVFSKTANLLYVGAFENCIAAFNTNLVEQPSLNIGNPTNGKPKGLSITTECCPDNDNMIVNRNVCNFTPGEKYYLQDIMGFEGAISEGTWTQLVTNPNMVFNPCDNSLTINGAGCTQFKLSSDGSWEYGECGAFEITLNISVNTVSAPVIGGNETLCSGADPSPTTISTAASVGAGTLTYQWQKSTIDCNTGFSDILGANGATYDPGPLSQTTHYRVVVTGATTCTPAGECRDTSNCITKNVIDLIISGGSSSILCHGASTGTISVNVSGGAAPYSYDWADIAGTNDIEDRNGLAAGTYSLTVTDANNCTKVRTYTITEPDEIVIGFTKNEATCSNNGSIDLTVTGGEGGYTYNWADLAGNNDPADRSNLGIGAYSVTVTDENNCSKSATITIDSQMQSEAGTGSNTTICQRSTTSIDLYGLLIGEDTGGTWSAGGSNPSGGTFNAIMGSFDPTGSSVGTYTFTYNFAAFGGCAADQAIVNVIIYPEPVVTLSDPADVCVDGSDMSFTASPVGGVFTTNAPAGFTSNGAAGTASLDVSAAGAGTYTVTYTYTDANGCDASQTVSVTIYPEPVVTLNDPANVCVDGADMSFTASPIGGVFTTNAPAGFTSNGAAGTASLDVSAAGAGTYTVTYTYTDANGCDASQTVSVTIYPEPVVTLNDPANVCVDGADMSFTATPIDGVFTTTAPAGFTSNGAAGTASLDVSTAGAGTYTVTYTYTDANGCDASQTVSVTIYPEPVVTLSDPANVCVDGADMSFTASPVGGVFTTTAPAGFTSNGAAGTASLDVSTAGAGTYTVTYTYTDANGCDASETVSVTIYPEPVAAITATDASCTPNDMIIQSGGSATLTASGGTSYLWDDNSTDPARIVSPVATTTYTVVVTDANGCTDTERKVITVVDPLSIVLNAPVTNPTSCIINDGAIDITVSGGTAPYTYDWADIAGTNNIEDRTGLNSGTYRVTVTDANGCQEIFETTLLGECVAVGNYVFMDNNDNGIFNNGTDMPLANVAVVLYASGATVGVTAPVASTSTNANGYYYFDNLTTGDYFVHIPSSNFASGQPLFNKESYPGADNTDNTDNNDNGGDTPVNGGISSYTFTLTPNAEPTGETQTDYPGALDDNNVNGTIDFTFRTEKVAVGNYVFMDNNDNGIFNTGTDMPLANVAVALYASGATVGVTAPVASTSTNANGYYYFDQLTEGDYFVHIPASNFALGQPLQDKESYPGADRGDAVDNNDNGSDTPVAGGISSNTFTLTPNSEPTGETQTDYPGALDDNNVNGTIDFTFAIACRPIACVEVKIKLDNNCERLITPEMVLAGSNLVTSSTHYELLVADINGQPVLNNLVTGKYAGQRLRYLIKDRRCPDFFCWGEIVVEDGSQPKIVRADFSKTPIYCFDTDFVLNNPKTVGNLGVKPSPRQSPAGTIVAGTVADEVFNLGIAEFTSCDPTCRLSVKWSDRLVTYGCDSLAKNGLWARIYRTWAATSSCNGMSKDTVQVIELRRPALNEFGFVNTNRSGVKTQSGVAAGATNYNWVVEYNNCSADKNLIQKGDWMPRINSTFHMLPDLNRQFYLDQIECNYSVQIKDTEFPICGGKGLKIDRELYIFDWCAGGIVDTLHILIKIGDFEAPSLEYAHHAPNALSTGPMDCTAAFPISAAGIKSTFGVAVTDNCGVANVSVSVKTKDRYVKGILVATNTWEQVEYAVMNGMMTGLPVGRHRLIIDAYDGCYNAVRDSFEFEVIDKIAPVMKCDDDLHVTLSNANGYTNGYAQVTAADIDEGSWDNCKLAWIRVRRNVPENCTSSFIAKGYDSNGNGKLDPMPADGDWTKADGFDINGDGDLADFGETFILKEGKLMTPLQDIVEFFCCDLTERVTIELWGEDASGNRNFCWNDLLLEDKVTPTCIAPRDVTIYCEDKNLATIDDRTASAAIWGDVTVSSGADCAALDIVYSTVKKLKCGAGYIDRIWTLTKQTVKGPITITCTQRITILPVREYDICFPKDVSSDCKTPIIDTVKTRELGCDILAVNVTDKRYDASDDECYKIFRTYTVINWCVYNDVCGDPMAGGNVYVVDRANFNNYGKAAIYVLVRDEDRDGDEEFYLSENTTINESKDFHFLGDTAPKNVYKSSLKSTLTKCSDEYYHSFMYTQIIKVYDEERPIVSGIRDTFCTDPAACSASITKVVTIKDNCTNKVELERQMLMIAPFQTLDAGKMIMYATPRWSTKDLGNGKFEITVSNLPEGLHDLIVVGRDECGNLSVATRIPFVVKDCKAPAPICINGLSTELMPDGNNGGMMAVWASDFVASKIYDCNGQGPETKDGLKLVTKYSINRVGEKADPAKTGLNFNCVDAGKTILVELHAWDEVGNHDFCVTYVEVQDNRKVSAGSATLGEISGLITTDDLKPVLGVNVDLSGGAQMNQNTGSNGTYQFSNLAKGSDYTVSPQLDKDHINGVSTFDLVQIQKHILGIKALDNPYRMIAADVNNSRSITTLDMIQIRKLILNIDTKFTSVPSWKFVDATYKFPDPSNPWSVPFPEVANVNDLEGKVKADFIAIKMGDVNGNASTSGAVAVETRSDKTMIITTDEQQLQKGENYSIVFKAKDLAKIQGYQFTLNVDPNLATIEGIDYTGVMKAENFGIFTRNGIITTSFVRAPLAGASSLAGSSAGNAGGETILFTLKLKAESNTALSRALMLNSRLTNMEAYNQSDEVMGVQLTFGAGAVADRAALRQNAPNPFSEETMVGFYLPKATKAVLTIRDLKGALIYRVEGNYSQGNNQVILKQEQLRASGVLYYNLETAEFTYTKKMVVLHR